MAGEIAAALSLFKDCGEWLENWRRLPLDRKNWYFSAISDSYRENRDALACSLLLLIFNEEHADRRCMKRICREDSRADCILVFLECARSDFEPPATIECVFTEMRRIDCRTRRRLRAYGACLAARREHAAREERLRVERWFPNLNEERAYVEMAEFLRSRMNPREWDMLAARHAEGVSCRDYAALNNLKHVGVKKILSRAVRNAGAIISNRYPEAVRGLAGRRRSGAGNTGVEAGGPMSDEG